MNNKKNGAIGLITFAIALILLRMYTQDNLIILMFSFLIGWFQASIGIGINNLWRTK